MGGPAYAMEMAHAREPGKMAYGRMGPSHMNDLALVMVRRPGKMVYYHVASLRVDDHPYTLEMAHAIVPDRMRYSHGEWWVVDILAFLMERAPVTSPGKM